MYPDELRYSDEHLWVRREGPRTVSLGVTAWVRHDIGDIVAVVLPDEGSQVVAGEACGRLESNRSLFELFTPVDGEVIEVNGELGDSPELIDGSPYGEGWLLEVECASPAAVDALLEGMLTSAQYENNLGG